MTVERDPIPETEPPPRLVRGHGWLAAALVVVGLGVLAAWPRSWEVLRPIGWIVAALCVVGVLVGAVALKRGRNPRIVTATKRFATGLAIGLVNIFLALVALLFALGYLGPHSVSGRALRRRGKARRAGLRSDTAWIASVPVKGIDERDLVAARWRENARVEHASVAAFAHLTLDLLALGAPPALVAAAQRDALDEVRHAQLCFGVATALDGRDEGPGDFRDARMPRRVPPSREAALAALAVEALVEGALFEGVSAHLLDRLSRRCDDEALRGVLAQLASDEARHAEHGWDVVAWCLGDGGESVARALRAAVDRLPRELASNEANAAALDGAWERHGIQGRALQAQAFAHVRADVVRRMTTTLATVGVVAA